MKKFAVILVLSLCSILRAENDESEVQSLSEQEIISKTFLKTPNINDLYKNTLVKSIIEIHPNGDWIRLSDGSSWNIEYFFGRREVRNYWKISDEVVITHTGKTNDKRGFHDLPPPSREAAIHNVTHSLSVWGSLRFPSKPNQADTVIITSILPNETVLQTSGNTEISFQKDASAWKEFSQGDIIMVLSPQKGILDGTKVHVWHLRLKRIYTNCDQTPINNFN